MSNKNLLFQVRFSFNILLQVFGQSGEKNQKKSPEIEKKCKVNLLKNYGNCNKKKQNNSQNAKIIKYKIFKSSKMAKNKNADIAKYHNFRKSKIIFC